MISINAIHPKVPTNKRFDGTCVEGCANKACLYCPNDDDAEFCTICDINFYPCPKDCSSCPNGECTTCKVGYRLNEESKQGEECISNDEKCTEDRNICEVYIDGFHAITTVGAENYGKCIRCDDKDCID